MNPTEFLSLIESDPDKAQDILLKVIIRSALDGHRWEAAVWLLSHYWPDKYKDINL